jgi:hexosaminidase
MTLRYTTDGSTPTAASPLVTGPITEKGVIQVAAFGRNGNSSLVARLEHR